MNQTLKPAPDWFDDLWDTTIAPQVPIYLRGETLKQTARGLTRILVERLGALATTPEGVRQIVAYARIATVCKAAMRANLGPDPTPEQVAEFVEKVVARVKP